MYIEPALPDFKHVTIRRTGGIVGLDQTLVIDKDLNAQVKCRLEGGRRGVEVERPGLRAIRQ